MIFYIYANSSSKIGLGHVVRQDVLARELIKRGHLVNFVYSARISEGNNSFKTSEVNYQKIDSIFALQNMPLNSVLIIDDYELTESQWQHCYKVAPSLVFFDDGVGRPPKPVDLVVNMSEEANIQAIGKVNLNGAKFRLIRDEIKQYNRLPFCHDEGLSELTVTVMLGANDVMGLLPDVCNLLNECDQIKNIKILTVLSKSIVHESFSQSKVNLDKIQVLSNSMSLGKEMKSCHFAICAAGGALYEYLCLGVPTIALIVADNQASALSSKNMNDSCILVDVRENLNKSILNAAVNRLVKNKTDRKNFSKSSQLLFDGLGAKRIVNHIELNIS